MRAPAPRRWHRSRRPGPVALRSPPLLRSAGVRFAVIYAVLLAISATALALFLWWATAGLLDRQTEAAIHADAQGLAERWTEGGLPALVSDDRGPAGPERR